MRRGNAAALFVGCLLAGIVAGPEAGDTPAQRATRVTVDGEIRAASGPDFVRHTPLTVPVRVTTSRPSRGLERPRTPPRPQAVDAEAVLARIVRCESGGNPQAVNRTSGASGLFQYLRSTWNNYAGYAEARLAPPDVQWARARSDYARVGGRPWIASIRCWGR